MSQYQIITDACADLPVKLVEELGVHVIPMSFNFGEESYTHYPDEREYTAKDFFDRLRNGDMSTTNQINQAEFTDVFESYLQNGLYWFFLCALRHLSQFCDGRGRIVQKISGANPPCGGLFDRYTRHGPVGVCGCAKATGRDDHPRAVPVGTKRALARLWMVHRGRPPLPQAGRPALRYSRVGRDYVRNQAYLAYYGRRKAGPYGKSPRT